MNRYDEELDSTGFPVTSLMYFTAGLVAGAAIALLVAPAAGRETRANLKRGTDTFKQKTRQLADDVRTKGREVWDEESARVTSAVQQGYNQAASLGEQLGDAVEQGKVAFRDVKSRAKSLVNDVRSETA